MKTLLVAAALVLVGCGGASGNDDLTGAWEAAVGTSCIIGFDAGPGPSYGFGVVCAGTGGALQVDTQRGSYVARNGTLTMNAARSTCTDTPKVSSSSYELAGGQLTLQDSTTVIVLTRVATSGSAVGTFGCFSNGTFTPAPLAPI